MPVFECCCLRSRPHNTVFVHNSSMTCLCSITSEQSANLRDPVHRLSASCLHTLIYEYYGLGCDKSHVGGMTLSSFPNHCFTPLLSLHRLAALYRAEAIGDICKVMYAISCPTKLDTIGCLESSTMTGGTRHETSKQRCERKSK